MTQKIPNPGSKWLIAASVQLQAQSACSIIHHMQPRGKRPFLFPRFDCSGILPCHRTPLHESLLVLSEGTGEVSGVTAEAFTIFTRF